MVDRHFEDEEELVEMDITSTFNFIVDSLHDTVFESDISEIEIDEDEIRVIREGNLPNLVVTVRQEE